MILLSPAKSLDLESGVMVPETTQPAFLDDSQRLVARLRRYSKPKLAELMSISDDLAALNKARFEQFDTPFTSDNARPALATFAGDVYTGLQARTLDREGLRFAQQHLRILSGLYGVLRPLDLMQPYRLEMGTRLKVGRADDLYRYWGSRLTEHLDTELQAQGLKLVVNLASREYFGAVKPSQLSVPVISPVFHDEKNGQYKLISFFAKKARGAMARHLIDSREVSIAAMKRFKLLGYRYSREDSTDKRPLFVRSEVAAARVAA